MKKEIAKLKTVEPEQIFLGNGSDEVIDLLFRAFCEPNRDKVLLFTPTYGMYRVCADINAVEVMEVPLNNEFQVDLDGAKQLISDPNLKLIFVCSPNNPTGNLIDKNSIIELTQQFQGLVVVDEAYIDFSPGGSVLPEINHIKNLVVLQTFSKAWGLASIRLGMAFANNEIINVLNKIKPPYNINFYTQQKALEIIKELDRKNEVVEEIIEERGKMKNALTELNIVSRVFFSDSNFLLVEFSSPKRVYEYLASKGIIVRDRTSAVKSCLRITIGTPNENTQLITALQQMTINN